MIADRTRTARGWAQQPDSDDDGEEDLSEEDHSRPHTPLDLATTHYSDTNHLLHDLHRNQLSRHRASSKEPDFGLKPTPAHSKFEATVPERGFTKGQCVEDRTQQVAQGYDDINK